MANHWKKLLVFVFAFITQAASAPAMAMIDKPIMMIVPDVVIIPLDANGHATLHYTVSNNTGNGNPNKGMPLDGLIINPVVNANNEIKLAVTLQNNTCADTTLHSASNCSFNLFLTGNDNLPNSFILSPHVCAFNGAICSQPNGDHRVIVMLRNIPA